MRRYLVKRGLQGIITMIAVLLMVFVAMRLAPGDPAELFLPEGAPPETIQALNERWGLRRPIHVQLGLFVRNVVQGDMGESFSYGRPVTDIILDRLPASIQLATAAFALSSVVAVPLGIMAATRRDTWLDNLTIGGALALQSMPSFWLALQLILVFSLMLGLLPPAGREGWKYMVLPTVALSAESLAGIIRILRVELVRVLVSDYIRTARSKGLGERIVLWRHALKNAAIPVVTVMGLWLASMFNGAVFIETVFAWPGVGRLGLEAILNRDYPLIQGVVVLIAFNYIIANILVDVLYAYLDPRIRLSG